jgi:hypothetical protein
MRRNLITAILYTLVTTVIFGLVYRDTPREAMRGSRLPRQAVHFREGRKNVLRSSQKIVLERPETRRAAVKPKQNKRRPQGGGRDQKQCPGDAQGSWTGDQRERFSKRESCATEERLMDRSRL